jgi:hypothetical protein
MKKLSLSAKNIHRRKLYAKGKDWMRWSDTKSKWVKA